MAQEPSATAPRAIRRSPAASRKRAKLPRLTSAQFLLVFGPSQQAKDFLILWANFGHHGPLGMVLGAGTAFLVHSFAFASGVQAKLAAPRPETSCPPSGIMHGAFARAVGELVAAQQQFVAARNRAIPNAFPEAGVDHPLDLAALFKKSSDPWYKRIIQNPESLTFVGTGLISALYIAGGSTMPLLGGEEVNWAKIAFGATLGAVSAIKLFERPPDPDKKRVLSPGAWAGILFSVPGVALWADDQFLAALCTWIGSAAIALGPEKEPKPGEEEIDHTDPKAVEKHVASMSPNQVAKMVSLVVRAASNDSGPRRRDPRGSRPPRSQPPPQPPMPKAA